MLMGRPPLVLRTTPNFNAKIGKLSQEEMSSTLPDHVGRYVVGTRNSNGEHLLNFVVGHDLFVCNSAFQHRSKHITTRTGWIRDNAASSRYTSVTKPVYTQIDYILCKARSKRILQDCRSYAGATLQSDHKIVLARVDLGKPYNMHRQKSKKTSYNVSRLTCNKAVQLNYQQSLDSKISNLVHRESTNPSCKLKALMTTI